MLGLSATDNSYLPSGRIYMTRRQLCIWIHNVQETWSICHWQLLLVGGINFRYIFDHFSCYMHYVHMLHAKNVIYLSLTIYIFRGNRKGEIFSHLARNVQQTWSVCYYQFLFVGRIYMTRRQLRICTHNV